MSHFTEAPIVRAEIAGPIEDIGAAASKAMRAAVSYRYKQAIVYTLDDGRELLTTKHGLTKPKLRSSVESEIRYASNGQLTANFMDGRFYSTTWSLALCVR